MRCSLVVCASVLLSWSLPAVATSPEQIVDPRPAGHVIDLAGVLDDAAKAAIEASVGNAAGGGELFVVVVEDTSGVGARAWTTEVFNRLRLDTQERNRGVLLMAAINDRKAEIVIGDGFDGSFTQLTDHVMSDVVVPHFKREAPQQAMVGGAATLANIMLQAPPSSSSPLPPQPLMISYRPVDARTPAFEKAVAAARKSAPLKAVIDPRPRNTVLDRAKALKGADIVAIDALLETKVHQEIQPVIVVVNDIGRHAPRVFATAAFEKLGLSSTTAGRGVLVLIVAGKKQRTVEIVHGPGFPAFTSAVLVPAGINLPALVRAAGARDAAIAAADILVDLSTHTMITLMNAERERDAAIAAAHHRDFERAEQQAKAAAAASTAAARAAAMTYEDFDPGVGTWAGGIGLLCIVGIGVREAIRRRPRRCRTCAVGMHRLHEEADDRHLSEGERAEERLGSVDYDIWACGTCGDVLKTRWGAIFTAYSRCRSCSWKTMRSSSRTVQAATEYSTGLAEVTDTCEHCGFHHVSTRIIPRRPPPSSSSSSSSGFSGGSGGGGGSSSGRGSSGSW